MIGIGVGLLVNLAVWPPLRDRSAARRVDRIDDRSARCSRTWRRGCRRASDEDDVEDWVERTRDLDHEIDAAWATVRQARESGRLNPRLSAAARMRRSDAFGDVLARLEQAVAETRSMARTITRADSSVSGDDDFRARWVELLRRAGAAVSDADSAALGEILADLESHRRGRAPAGARRAAGQPAQHPRCDGRGRRRAAGARRRPPRSGAQLTIGLPSG